MKIFKKDENQSKALVVNGKVEYIANRRELLAAIIGIVMLLVFIIVTLSLLDNGDTNSGYRKRFRHYNDGWTVINHEGRFMDNLPAHVTINDGETLILKKKLPDNIPQYSAIAARNYHLYMEVRVDDETIFTYPEGNEHGIINLISDEWSIINLKPEHKGKPLEIRYTSGAVGHFSGYLSDVYFGDDNSLIQHLREDNFWGFMSGAFLIILGIFLIGIGIIYKKFTHQEPNIAMGFVQLCFGIWLANRSKMPFFSTNNDKMFLLSLVAVVSVASFIFLYGYFRHSKGNKISKLGFRLSILFAGIILLGCFVIRYNVQHVAMIAYFLCFAAILHNGYLLYGTSFGPDARLKNKTELTLDRIEFFTTALFPIGGALEMIYFRHQLWTEVSGFFRIVIVLYAVMYIVTIVGRTYLVVKDRTLVTERLHESQLELMMGQIQPHFLFNTLSSIRTLVKVDPDIAYSMLYDFSNYLRANVDNVTNLDGIKFIAEVDHIKSYVNIEKVRFGDRLNVEYDIEVSEFMVPPLSIQPLVENAIKHGVCQRLQGGTVWLRSYETEEYNVVEIQDDGIGFNKEAASAVFSVYKDNDNRVGIESNQAAVIAMKETLENVELQEEDGTPVVLDGPVNRVNLSGNGSEEHKSTGMMNIIMRLREMANAKIEIKSKVNEGTRIRVLFPKESQDLRYNES